MNKLDESTHYNNVELVRIVNKLLEEIETLHEEIEEINFYLGR